MATYWQPTGAEKARLREALDDAFDAQSMELLISDYFSPKSFSKISPFSSDTNAEYRLFKLIEAARMEGWLLDLVMAARERRLWNPRIVEVTEAFGLSASGPRLDNPTGTPFEAIIQEYATFIDPQGFREKLALREGQVCKINIPGGGGTGFLVGPDLVLTNAHVIDPLLKGFANWRDVTCLFDYKQALNGATSRLKRKTEVRLAAPEWLVAWRPPSQYDWEQKLGDAAPDEIDSALLRLEEPIGAMKVGGDTLDGVAPKRGWIDAQATPPALAAGNQIFLLQHPEGEPLQLAIGKVKQLNANGTRLRYDANSKKGSSGSPCFNADLELVALHHAYDLSSPPEWNQAIPLRLIQKIFWFG